ncbi:hypothetical protein BAUCODRAFT_333306 [Baudoinia panamericana UAMH 10762]|uniref:Uncharacterized protein n=1 Tax=Baudoinia panamericana (strain UAMH 10762) TaxID=717646 RepID=M2MXR4_BAUPA|nr:uncharacterized protein BAUCODRAFT_333306 [Baudoinia panamericana UAMH 10762]EMC91030.1 hypothetical protein BAUCODRAFT_333306 [Baudoinia panamericana UAMH 10762]
MYRQEYQASASDWGSALRLPTSEDVVAVPDFVITAVSAVLYLRAHWQCLDLPIQLSIPSSAKIVDFPPPTRFGPSGGVWCYRIVRHSCWTPTY